MVGNFAYRCRNILTHCGNHYQGIVWCGEGAPSLCQICELRVVGKVDRSALGELWSKFLVRYSLTRDHGDAIGSSQLVGNGGTELRDTSKDYAQGGSKLSSHLGSLENRKAEEQH